MSMVWWSLATLVNDKVIFWNGITYYLELMLIKEKVKNASWNKKFKWNLITLKTDHQSARRASQKLLKVRKVSFAKEYGQRTTSLRVRVVLALVEAAATVVRCRRFIVTLKLTDLGQFGSYRKHENDNINCKLEQQLNWNGKLDQQTTFS